MTPADRQTLARKLDYLRKQSETPEPYRTLPTADLLGSLERRFSVSILIIDEEF